MTTIDILRRRLNLSKQVESGEIEIGSCSFCKGSGKTFFYRCPRALVSVGSKLLPYFYEYYYGVVNPNGGVGYGPKYPNGKPRMFQYWKLLKIFDILTRQKSKIDVEKTKE